MKTSGKKSILYLDTDALYFYGSGLDKPIKFKYPSKALSDLEVYDHGLLETSLETTLFSTKRILSPLLIILSKDCTFQKKIALNGQDEIKLEFLESIPFENVSLKHYNAQEGGPLVVTNRDLYQAFQTIFSGHGFSVEAIVPEVMLPAKLKGFNPKEKVSMDLLLSTPVSNNLSIVGLNNKYEPRIKKMAGKQFAVNKNLRTLLALFLFALFILGGSFFYSKIKYSRPPLAVVTPTAGVTPTKALNPEDPAILPVKIYYFAKGDMLAKQLQSYLWSTGFKKTDLVASTSAITKTSLSAPPEISALLLQKIKLELDKVDRGYSLIQPENIDNNVNIYLASPKK